MKKKTVFQPVKMTPKQRADAIKTMDSLREEWFAKYREALDEAERCRVRYVDAAHRLYLLREKKV